AQADTDDYWLATNKGLIRFHPAGMKFQRFSAADGLQALEFNRASCFHTADGTLWFGGIGGYNHFRPAEIQALTTVPAIRIVDIQINEKPYPYPDNPVERRSLRLPYDSATLAFHFAALEFSDPANNHLRYRLRYADNRDFDRDWIYCPDAKGFARYTKLPPGSYKLQIMATNSDSLWNPVPKEFFIEITPPYYQTWWFRALLSLAGLLLLYAFYRFRLAGMRKKEEQKRKMIELELNVLRTQLNPHFISNNLISINHFIRNNGVEKVRAYVSTFARLMRNVLESARNPTVSLTDELDMLRNFVAVESGRFPQPIDFSVQLQPGIDPDQIALPGMLLQPFVENAIVHGLAPRNGEGHITIRVSRERDALVFTVEDDGLGRNSRPASSGGERKSHGLDITRERLHLHDLQHGSSSSLSLEDLKNDDGTVMGTRVILRLGFSPAG
ncbi:MAG: histidine kinase, partial [Saprospiraceae bacterium]